MLYVCLYRDVVVKRCILGVFGGVFSYVGLYENVDVDI